ncbi:MAG TPA: 3-oxoacid CoA-transferase subunit A [Dehalococcoidia bacterium]|nr:3-oxoacid CoA-transferase subunit A [Dehalococcoidia bacterium]
MNKIVDSFEEAIADIRDGATIMIGYFGHAGDAPCWLIRALAEKGTKNLTIISNMPGWGRTLIPAFREMVKGLIRNPSWWDDAGLLVENGQVRKAVVSWASGMSPAHVNDFEKRYQAGEVELEMVPQGTLAERIRAGKAGIPAFYVPTGAGTVVEEGKEVRVFNGRRHILEHALTADFALIHAHKADRWGNLVYQGTSRTFNATMAGAAKVTIAEVDEIVELGELDPEAVVTPNIYVDRVVARPLEELRKW